MTKNKKTLSQAIQERRATPSFDGSPIPPEDLRQILDAGLHAPSGYNMQPWRFIVVQSPEQKKKLRAASYNQGKVEEASAVIVACGDADGWRKDLDLMLELGRKGGMPESYSAQAAVSVPNYLSSFNIVNGDVFRWNWMWPRLAEWFGIEPAPFPGQGTPLEQQLAGTEDIWRNIAKSHNLIEPNLNALVSAWHTDADLGRPIEVVTDMSKSRKLGFLDYQSTDDSFFALFTRLRQNHIIP